MTDSSAPRLVGGSLGGGEEERVMIEQLGMSHYRDTTGESTCRAKTTPT